MTHLDVLLVKHQYANSLAQCKQTGLGFERRAVVNNASQVIGAAHIKKAPASVRLAGESYIDGASTGRRVISGVGWLTFHWY